MNIHCLHTVDGVLSHSQLSLSHQLKVGSQTPKHLGILSQLKTFVSNLLGYFANSCLSF